MSRLVYLDFLRQVTPPTSEDEISLQRDFIIFGGFDALRVDYSADTIQQMKKKHEAGHEEIAAIYDRQPMFLYQPYNPDTNIFSIEGESEDLPLVVSIIQIDKKKYSENSNASASDLTQRFENIINQYIASEIESYDYDLALKMSVFWNLGESDIVVAFRSKHLHPIANIIHKIRILHNDSFQVFSTCSHCGFPWSKDMNETHRKMIQWLTREKAVGKTGFLSFINTSSAYHRLNDIFDQPKGIQGAFLFGEWDYSSFQRFENNTTVEDIAEQILLSAYTTDHHPYKTSYTLPAVIIDNLGEVNGRRLEDSDKWIERIKAKFKSLTDYLEEIKTPDDPDRPNNNELISEKSRTTLSSLSHTFTGLGKFLLRLYYGRYEQDLYAYAKPVFEAIPVVIDNYKKQITGIWKNANLDTTKKGKIISRLVMEVVDDCTQLISSLQHLFAVLSVSPHTFMETYGSNMRSLTAADKLVDAYQGLISFLCAEFPDIIKDEGKSILGQHHVLIIPHRQSYPLHTLFFKSASPILRISRIEMDFPKMFEIRASVYVILHECAHHLGDRLRDERYESYYRACAYLAAESILGKYLYQPVASFISTTSQSVLNQNNPPLFRGLTDTDKKEIVSFCKNNVANQARLGIDALAADIEKVLKETEKLTSHEKGGTVKEELKQDYERLFRDQHYSIYIHAYLHGLFRNAFPVTENGLSEKARKVYSNVIQKYFTAGLTSIAEKTAEKNIPERWKRI